MHELGFGQAVEVRHARVELGAQDGTACLAGDAVLVTLKSRSARAIIEPWRGADQLTGSEPPRVTPPSNVWGDSARSFRKRRGPDESDQ